jgi:hypothetical protein
MAVARMTGRAKDQQSKKRRAASSPSTVNECRSRLFLCDGGGPLFLSWDERRRWYSRIEVNFDCLINFNGLLGESGVRPMQNQTKTCFLFNSEKDLRHAMVTEQFCLGQMPN